MILNHSPRICAANDVTSRTRHVRIAFPETEEGTSVICPSRWRESFGCTRASADVWGIYKVSHTVVLGAGGSIRIELRLIYISHIYICDRISAREPPSSIPAGIPSHRDALSNARVVDTVNRLVMWRSVTSRKLAPTRGATASSRWIYGKRRGGWGQVDHGGGKGEGRTRVVPRAEGVLVSSSRAHREANLWRRPMLIRC
jgi:hypothetical protein